MRIAFITGSAELGGSGVGDYTRILAIECARRGIPIQVIALADDYVTQDTVEQWSHGVLVKRLSHRQSWPARIRTAQGVLRGFRPSWISLQFVAYSYHRRGVPFAFYWLLPRLIGRLPLHVMFHEIWVGPQGSWRRWLVGGLQRRMALGLASRAASVHTSNAWYRDLLIRQGIKADILPLFGNVAVTETVASSWFLGALKAVGCDATGQSRGDWWILVLFGTIHPEWPSAPLLPRLAKAAIDAGKKVVIVSVGRLGADTGPWRTMTRRHAADAAFVILGEQPEERVAEILGHADFGIATSPYVLLGKSGTVAAMFDHGLPVIANRDDGLTISDEGLDERGRALIVRLDDHFAERLRTVRRLPAQSSVVQCATQWLHALQSATAPAGSCK